MRMQKQSKTYEEFVEKFKRKKTTDDCYTPPEIYEAVKEWAIDKYGLKGREVIRPFWPETDYQTIEYPEGCVVIDNPPFSILTKIVRWYEERGIDYFLFAQHLSLFSANAGRSNYVVAYNRLTYENGAYVTTSFITSLGKSKITIANTLHVKIREAEGKLGKPKAPTRYNHPENVYNAALIGKYLNRDAGDVEIAANECEYVTTIDGLGGPLFGKGFIISDGAVARLKENKPKPYDLSEREKKIIEILNIKSGGTV